MKRLVLLRLVPTMALSMFGGHCVAATCSVAAGTVNFGAYSPISGSVVNSTATVAVSCIDYCSCTFGSYTVALNAGTYGTLGTRQMGTSTLRVNYNIYKDSAYTQIWGDSTSSTFTNSGSYAFTCAFGCVTNFTAYGQIPASQTTVQAGSYSSTVTVTVTYT
ncbi:spore coat U domain-containing protein [Aquabacterium sp.]|uniref:Csu type fimbrial protein n=1 Tax=Aquabacterium sp. TaxID=1872578 RepID=UPI0019A1AA27|nr:spore coat U domain-containing protein [Aquabacterium sp.]MBC7700630.1 spore coat protein U domain-containing protein [Aquabacterium sp.]